MYRKNEWIEVDGYRIKLSEVKEEIVLESSKKIRAVRIHILYENQTEQPLKHVTLQWLLYDTEGYSYSSTITRKFYGDDASRKLSEGLLSPGKKVRGWVAFELPKDAKPDYLQFRKNFMADSVVEIALNGKSFRPSPKKETKGEKQKEDVKNEMLSCRYCNVSQPVGRSYCVGCGAALPNPSAVGKFVSKVQEIFGEREKNNVEEKS